jgi:hypothetical protein
VVPLAGAHVWPELRAAPSRGIVVVLFATPASSQLGRAFLLSADGGQDSDK